MSRNKENSPVIARQRANGSLLSSTRTPPSEDFFTDSVLDASKIPSPSPQKQQYVSNYSRSRRAFPKPTLTDAWNRTGDLRRGSASSSEAIPKSTVVQNDPGKAKGRAEIKPRTLAEIWNGETAGTRNGTSQPRKPAPVDVRSSPALAQRQQRTTTPSPPRRLKAIDPKSPTSEVSQDLTDVYQRIADEEDLAAQEGQIEEEEEEEDYPYNEGSIHDSYEPEGTGDVRQNLSQPISSRESAKPLPHRPLDDIQNVGDEITSLSEASGLSFLKEMTDQKLAAALTPHTIDRAKDRARLERAINNQNPILFNGQKSRQGLTIENLQRTGGSPAGQLVRKNSSSGSVNTDRSDPAPNVPREWGRKARAGKEWLRSRRAGSVQSSPGLESSQVDWAAAAANIALPSVEDSSTPRRDSMRESAPASLHKQTSLDRIKQWELNDFTGQSFQVSNSPPVRIKAGLPDPSRDREIEGLERRAVTTNRLSEIGRKNSSELLKRLSRSPSAGQQSKDPDSATPSEKAKGLKFAEEGEEIPDTPIVVHKSSSENSKTEIETENGQPGHGKKKSHDHLQRLARALSNSPRASPSPEDWSLIGSEEGLKRSYGQSEKSPEATPPIDTSRKSSKQVVAAESTPQVVNAAAAAAAKTPIITGAWTDTVLPDTIKTVKKQDERSRYAQTPHVKPGGWVDTPLPNKRHSSALAPIPIEEETEELANDLPELPPNGAMLVASPPPEKVLVSRQSDMPTSALASLLERAKRRLVSEDITSTKDANDTLNLGDATIESLEELLTLDAADMSALILMGAEAEVHDQLLANLNRNDQAAESELLERLGTKLERLRTNIHDARKGISKLEHQVAHPTLEPRQQLQPLSAGTPCEACGCSRTIATLNPFSPGYKVYLALPIPRLFHPRRKDLGHWFPRPTGLGWITLLAWLWYISESTMCELYCHPLYADHYIWPREPEPRFPWVLPTMLWRWSGLRKTLPMLLGPVWTLLTAFVSIIGQALGLTDGFADGKYTGSGSGGEAFLGSQTQTAGVGQRDGIDLSMMNDEYL